MATSNDRFVESKIDIELSSDGGTKQPTTMIYDPDDLARIILEFSRNVMIHYIQGAMTEVELVATPVGAVELNDVHWNAKLFVDDIELMFVQSSRNSSSGVVYARYTFRKN